MRASVRLVGRAPIVFAVLAAALVCAGSASASVRLDHGHDRRVGLDTACVRLPPPERHPTGRRLARSHPLPRARAVVRGHGADRLDAFSEFGSPCSPATPGAPATRGQVRARRTEGSAGRTGPLRLVCRPERRLRHLYRRLRPLARGRGGLERCRRRRSLQGDRPGDHVDEPRDCAQSQRRPEDRPDLHPLPGRADRRTGIRRSSRPSRTCSRATSRPGTRARKRPAPPRSHLHALTVPTLMLQGRHDFLFDMDQATAAWKLLAGPKRLFLGDLGHPPAKNPTAEEP